MKKKFNALGNKRKSNTQSESFNIKTPFPDMKTFEDWLHLQNRLCFYLLKQEKLDS